MSSVGTMISTRTAGFGDTKLTKLCNRRYIILYMFNTMITRIVGMPHARTHTHTRVHTHHIAYPNIRILIDGPECFSEVHITILCEISKLHSPPAGQQHIIPSIEDAGQELDSFAGVLRQLVPAVVGFHGNS